MKGEKFRDLLISWGRKNLRDFPWRKNRTPYKMLICELFLQRTKAEQVVPIYENFIQKYETITALHIASYEELFRNMQGLGLKKRVGMLKEIAREIHTAHRDEIPNSYTELVSLKGIGQYLANAILCFGFNERVPILDSNIIRIFDRALGVTSRTKSAKYDKKLWAFAEDLLPEKDFVLYNYALIDFGALICTPKQPRHDACFFIRNCMFIRRALRR